MLVAGDELGRTQHGNNNAYCQDNEISWFDWHLEREARAPRVHEARPRGPARASRALSLQFFQGREIHGTELEDLLWFRHDGVRMSNEDWENAEHAEPRDVPRRAGIDEVDEEGAPSSTTTSCSSSTRATSISFALPKLDAVTEPWELAARHVERRVAQSPASRGTDARSSAAR